MTYNLVTLTATVDGDIECQSGKHLALFKVKFYTAKQAGTIPIVTFDNVADYVEKSLKEGSIIVIKGNLTQYNDEIEIIANSLDILDSNGKVVSSVKKETHKAWPDAAAPDKATAAEKPAGESPNDLRERLAKLEKMLSDAGKSHDT